MELSKKKTWWGLQIIQEVGASVLVGGILVFYQAANSNILNEESKTNGDVTVGTSGEGEMLFFLPPFPHPDSIATAP